MPYNIKICNRCQKEYYPTSGYQYVCLECKPIADKERRKKLDELPEVKERKRMAVRGWYQRNPEYRAKKQRYMRERRKNNPEVRLHSYLRGKDRLKLLRYTAEQTAKCFMCGAGWPLHVHHFDKNHKNHDIENLKWVCVKCHMQIHNYFYNPVVDKQIS